MSGCWRTVYTTQIKNTDLTKRYYTCDSSVHLISLRFYIPVCILRSDHSSVSLTFLFKAAIYDPVSCPTSNPAGSPNPSPSHAFEYNPSSCFPSASSSPEARRRGGQSSNTKMEALGDSRQEMLNLKEQLEALRCQVGCCLQHSIEKKCSHF